MLDYGTIRQELEKYPALTLPVVRKIIIDIREAKLPDPKVMGNAGSFFMNPIVPREKLEALQQEYPGMPYYELPEGCLLYTSPSPRDRQKSRMPSSA